MILLIFRLGMITKAFQEDYPCYMGDVFMSTDFWPELRQTTDAYQRYDLSMKQKLPVKGLELYLNISNLGEAVDVNRLNGFNPKDPDFDDAVLDDLASERDKSIEERLEMIPRSSRAKVLSNTMEGPLT